MSKSCSRLFKILVGKLEKKDVVETWAMISWAIWNARNKFYFERTQAHSKKNHDSAMGFLEEYQRHVATQRP